MFVGARQAGLSISKTADLLGFSRTTISRKRRLQVAQAHQNWTIEDWKNVVWSDESRFMLRHSDGRSESGVKNILDPSCLVSTVQAGGGGVMDIFLAHFNQIIYA